MKKAILAAGLAVLFSLGQSSVRAAEISRDFERPKDKQVGVLMDIFLDRALDVCQETCAEGEKIAADPAEKPELTTDGIWQISKEVGPIRLIVELAAEKGPIEKVDKRYYLNHELAVEDPQEMGSTVWYAQASVSDCAIVRAGETISFYPNGRVKSFAIHSSAKASYEISWDKAGKIKGEHWAPTEGVVGIFAESAMKADKLLSAKEREAKEGESELARQRRIHSEEIKVLARDIRESMRGWDKNRREALEQQRIIAEALRERALHPEQGEAIYRETISAIMEIGQWNKLAKVYDTTERADQYAKNKEQIRQAIVKFEPETKEWWEQLYSELWKDGIILSPMYDDIKYQFPELGLKRPYELPLNKEVGDLITVLLRRALRDPKPYGDNISLVRSETGNPISFSVRLSATRRYEAKWDGDGKLTEEKIVEEKQ